MTTKQQLQDQLAKLEQSHKAEMAELRAKIESMKDEPQGVWRPRAGEMYWYVSSSGSAANGFWFPKEKVCQDYLALGNVYRTKQETEDYARYRRIHQKLKELAGGWVPDWENGDQIKYYFLGWDHDSGRPYRDHSWRIQLSSIPFQTAEARDKAGEAIGAEDLKFCLTYGG